MLGLMPIFPEEINQILEKAEQGDPDVFFHLNHIVQEKAKNSRL